MSTSTKPEGLEGTKEHGWVNVKMSRALFEAFIGHRLPKARIKSWGTPDAEGFWVPTTEKIDPLDDFLTDTFDNESPAVVD